MSKEVSQALTTPMATVGTQLGEKGAKGRAGGHGGWEQERSSVDGGLSLRRHGKHGECS